jgi:hypothetical protein
VLAGHEDAIGIGHHCEWRTFDIEKSFVHKSNDPVKLAKRDVTSIIALTICGADADFLISCEGLLPATRPR